MMMAFFVLIAVIFCAVAVAILGFGLRSKRVSGRAESELVQTNVEALKASYADLKAGHDAGKISDDEFEETRAERERLPEFRGNLQGLINQLLRLSVKRAVLRRKAVSPVSKNLSLRFAVNQHGKLLIGGCRLIKALQSVVCTGEQHPAIHVLRIFLQALLKLLELFIQLGHRVTARLILGLHAGDRRIHGVPSAEAPVDHRSRDRNKDRDKGKCRKTLTLIGFVE